MFLTNKRFWKTIALCFAIGVMLLLIVYAAVALWSKSRLEARLARLQAAGEPTSLAELAVPVPVDDNAALVLAEVRPQLEQFTQAQATFDKTPQGAAYREFAFKTAAPTDEQIDMIRGILAMYPEVPSALEKAAECNYHVPLLDYSLKPQYFFDLLNHSITLSRNAGRFGSWQIAVAIADGDYDGAARIGMNMLKLARLRDSEPTLISGLVGLALRGAAVRDLNRVLRSGELSPETRLLVDQELARHDDPMWLVKIMKTERAYNLDASLDVFFAFPSIQGRAAQADILDVYEDLLPLLAKPWHETKGGKINAVFIRQSPIPILNALPVAGPQAELLLPGMQAANEAFHRTVAEMRSLRILNALQSYKEETGNEADALDDLDLPASAMLDPFDGKRLKLKDTDGGWLIYSAYRNGKDDGGDFENANDTGIAPLGYPGAD